MKEERYSRSEALLGEGSTDVLKKAHVAVFGLGGVGSYLVEALARMGVGELTLVDGDAYTESNLNRQLFATMKTLGTTKTEAAAARIAEIDPRIKVHVKSIFVTKENANDLLSGDIDYIADAIDTVSAKLALVKAANERRIPIISAMGAGNKTDPTLFRVADISKTKVCPLARVMRTELRRMGILHLKTVYSEEEPAHALGIDEESGKPIPSSASFVPSVMGLIMAGETIKDILK